MTTKEFQNILAEKGSYLTERDGPGRSVMDRLTGWSDVRYYAGLLRTIFSGNRFARRNRFTPDVWADHSFRVIRTIEKCGGRIDISGFENLTQLKGPAVYVANHMSLLETLMFPSMLVQFNYLAVVVKQSLTEYPVFGCVMRAVEPVIVGRKDARKDLKTVLENGRLFLSQGRSVLIFPQSTRSPVLEEKNFNSLGSKLASRSDVPAIPVALKTDFHGIGGKFRDAGKIDRRRTIYFKFGPPISASEDPRRAHREVLGFIASNLEKWKEIE